MPDRSAASSDRIKALTQRLESDPRPRVFMDLARAYQEAGDASEAVRVCREGLEKQPGFHSARVLLGKLLVEAGEPVQAMDELQKVVSQAPDNLLARRLLGAAQEQAGRTDEALETYRVLLTLHPNDPEVADKIGILEAGVAPGPPPQSREPVPPEPGHGESLPEPPEAAPGSRRPAEQGVETLDVRQEVEEEAEPPATPPEEPAAAGGPEEEAAPPTAEMDTPGMPPEEPVAGGDPEEEAAPPTAEMESPEPPAGEGTAPRTVAMDAADIATVEDAEERPTRALDPSDLPGLPGGEGGDEARPTVALESPLDVTEPQPVPPGEGAETAVPPGAGGEAAGEEPRPARTVRIPGPVTETPGRPGAPGEGMPARAEGGPGLTEDGDSSSREEALPTPTLAELYLEQGMPEKAVAVYEQLLAGDPHNEEIRRKLEEHRGGTPRREAAARARIRALRDWLERIKRSHDAQSGP